MSRRDFFLANVAALCLAGCGFHVGSHAITPPEAQAACRIACEGAQVAGADAATTNACLLRCDTIVTPTAPPQVVTASPAPSASPTSSPTVAPPAIETAIPIGGVCQETHAGATPASHFHDAVDAAERAWIDANPDKWTPSGLGGAQRRLAVADCALFYSDVVRALRAGGLDAAIEADGNGGPTAIVVAARGDASFHEGYAILVSSGDVRFPGSAPNWNGFMGRCEPRGFDVGTATPAPTPAAACPPLLTVGAATKGDRQSFPAGPGRLIDLTGRFLVDGKNLPCNREKWANCGTAGGGVDAVGNQILGSGDLCEPAPAAIEMAIESAAYTTTIEGYAGRVVGPVGSPFTVTVRLRANAVDKAGRPMDLSHFYPFVLRGAI